jgi:hypothetical protein
MTGMMIFFLCMRSMINLKDAQEAEVFSTP